MIGCGVVGLSTALLLQQRGFNPVIYAKEEIDSGTRFDSPWKVCEDIRNRSSSKRKMSFGT